MTHCLTCFFQDTLDKASSPFTGVDGFGSFVVVIVIVQVILSPPFSPCDFRSLLLFFSCCFCFPLCLKDGNISIQDFLSNKSQKSEDFWFIHDIITKFKDEEKLPSSYI